MNKLFVVMYHYTRDLQHSRYPNIKAIDQQLFEEQLDYFSKNFHVVSMEMALESLDGKELPENAVLLTFDDGYIDNFTVAFPLLKKYHMQGSFFIPGMPLMENRVLDVNKIQFILAAADSMELKKELSEMLNRFRNNEYPEIPATEELYRIYGKPNRYDTPDTVFVKKILQTGLPPKLRRELVDILFEKYVSVPEEVFSRELYMNRDQIRCMRDAGMFIGVHGYEHQWLSHLTSEQMRKDISRGVEVLDEFIDTKSWVMNYPYGDYNERIMEYLSGCGCRMAVTIETRVSNVKKDHRYRIPRLDCNDFPPKSKNYIEIESVSCDSQ